MNDLLVAKMVAEFNTLDHDGKGYLVAKDYLMRATRITGYFGVSADTPQARQLTDEYTRLWDSLHGSADTNNDGRVDQAEFVDAVVPLMSRRGIFELSMGRLLDAIFAVCDMDGDGRILVTDVVSFLAAINVCTRTATATFRMMDRDGSGDVDRTEFRQIIKELYCSTDPTAPGSVMLAARCPITPEPATAPSESASCATG